MYIPDQQLRIVHQELLREALEQQSTQPRRPPKRITVKEKHT